MPEQIPASMAGVVAFHGHYCPGLTIGYRAALLALRELGVSRAQDEELLVIAENDACGIDAIQFLTGCTIGKGNLIFRDWGKQVFTFGRRNGGKMLRLALRPDALETPPLGDPTDDPAERRRLRLERLHTVSDADLFDMRWVDAPMPEKARIFKSVRCAQCGESVMEPRAHLQDGQPVCPECYGESYRRGW